MGLKGDCTYCINTHTLQFNVPQMSDRIFTHNPLTCFQRVYVSTCAILNLLSIIIIIIIIKASALHQSSDVFIWWQFLLLEFKTLHKLLITLEALLCSSRHLHLQAALMFVWFSQTQQRETRVMRNKTGHMDFHGESLS